MKKFFTLIALYAISSCAMMAQDQIQNGGFEDWGLDAENTPKEGETVSTKVSEPRYWHSFSSAYGFFKGFAGNHCFISTDAHSGNYSACIKATTTIFDDITANGTLTTGRLKAGSSDANSPENHSELDMSKTDEDRNKDPYYQVMTSRPDSIVFWVKYSTGKTGTTANMSAYITDGTYYQAPEDKTYNNKVGWAENPNIAPCTSYPPYLFYQCHTWRRCW